MDSKELDEHFKRIQLELEAQDRREQEQEYAREQIRKRILEEAELKRGQRDERQIREQLKKEGLIPAPRRVYFRHESRAYKTTIEARGSLGEIRLQISSRHGPQLRRTIGVSLLRCLKPALRYMRDFEIYHEGDFLSFPRAGGQGAAPLDTHPTLLRMRDRLGFKSG